MEYHSNHNSNSASTASTVATTRRNRSTTKNPERPQQQTAKEVIAANVQSLIEQLEAGHSDALTAYLNAMTVAPTQPAIRPKSRLTSLRP